jgi:chromosome segregation ATPase
VCVCVCVCVIKAKLKATASSAARKEAQIKSLQERLAEVGKSAAARSAAEADKEEKTSARLRNELRRREGELRQAREEVAAAHEALEMAAQVSTFVNSVTRPILALS